MRILITGSNGFIGRALGRRLNNDAEVIGIVRRPVGLPWQTHICDWLIDDPSQYSGFKDVDVLIHTAFQPPKIGVDPSDCLASNEAMAKNVVAFVRNTSAKHILVISSGSVYHEQAAELTEATPLAGASGSAYSRSCQAIEEIFRRSLSGRSLVIARVFFPYGPGQQDERLVPRLARQITEDLPVEIQNGVGPRINPIYITDAAEALRRLALRTDRGTVIANIGGGETTSIRELTVRIASLLGKPCSFVTRNQGQVAKNLFCSTQELRTLVDFVPQTSLRDGLGLTLNSLAEEPASHKSAQMASRVVSRRELGP